MPEPILIGLNLGDRIRISPPIWPDAKLDIDPGDLTKFAPQGNGVYGYQNPAGGNPFTSAPRDEACGGVLYFDNGISRTDFDALMRIAEVQNQLTVNPSKDFAVFTQESENPEADGYVAQLRIVSRFGLRFLFGALTEEAYNRFPSQEMSMADTLWSFIEHEKKRWGTSWGSGGLSGKFGGDGHFACEQLSFGIMVENDYHHIYRIWSRAWLVTK